MKSKLVLGTLTMVATLIGSGTALAQEYQTRADAIVSGDGTLWQDLGAPRQPVNAALAGRTREQVKAELAEAVRADAILSGDGTLWKDLSAPVGAANAALAGKTREQVKAELAEAIRADTILSGDGTLWQDLGAQRRAATSLMARADH